MQFSVLKRQYFREQDFKLKDPFGGKNAWNESKWEYLDTINEDNFYVVPMKVIGFRPCQKHVPFMRSGKMIVMDPQEEDHYIGYWWDKENERQLPAGKTPLSNNTGVWGDYRDYEYYYNLHQNYVDN